VSAHAIDEVLASYPQRYQPVAEAESLGGAGGLSGARLWRYRSPEGVLVLRAWPPQGHGRAPLEQIHRWLSLAVGLGFIPAPIPDRAGRTLQEHDGRFWELAPWMAGTADPSRPPSPARLRSAFVALAALHQRLSTERRQGVSAGLGHRYHTVVQLLQGGLDALEQAIGLSSETGEAACRDAAVRWAALARIVAPRLREPLHKAAGRVVTLQPCLRDARPEHFLFEGDRLSGLVDFGAMGIDCVAGDLARLMGEWLDGDPTARSEALAAYEQVRPLDAAENALIGAFESSSALLIGEHWIRWHFVEGRRFDDPRAVTQGIARGVERLDRLASQGQRGLPTWSLPP
jgi:Ser/Thr protein kinase RdoA (MazF antagonist)